MVCPKAVGHGWGSILALALVGSAFAQPVDFSARLRDARQLRADDRFAEARAALREVLQDARQEGNRRLEAVVLDNLGLNEQDRGNYPAAETAFNHGISTLHAEAADDSTLIVLKCHVAELYIAERRAEDAEPLLRQSVAALRGSTITMPLALSLASEDLAVTLIMRKKFTEPETLLREAMALIENSGGPDDPRLTSSLLTYAGLLMAQHRYPEAVEPAERAWRLLNKSSMHVPKPYFASALSVMGAVYLHAGRLEEAEECARRSVEIAEQSLGPHHPRLGLYLSNYAIILKSAGRRSDAKSAQKRADEIKGQYPPAGSPGYTVNVASLR